MVKCIQIDDIYQLFVQKMEIPCDYCIYHDLKHALTPCCVHCGYHECDGICRQDIRLCYFQKPLVVYKMIYHDKALRERLIKHTYITYDFVNYFCMMMRSVRQWQLCNFSGALKTAVIKKQATWTNNINQIVQCFMLCKQIIIDDIMINIIYLLYHLIVNDFTLQGYEFEYRCIDHITL